jgi:Zn-dependent M28 family amino/carboxypeptidase
LFTSSGLDFEALRLGADQRGFKPVPLSATASVTLKSSIRSGSSHNIVAVIPGAEHADEYIVYMGHWDHLGNGGESADGDTIFNGAVDNATGVAAALEIAEAFAHAETKPARSIVFMIPTMEESGLLGSRYYVNHPVFPLERTVGVINMDALPIRGRSKDIAVIGYGQSTMEELLVTAAKAQDRVVVPEPTPEKGFYYRSDQFNFAKKGVPALYARAGFDLREGGVAAGMAEAEDYTNNRYHSVHDEFDPSWDFSGVLEDIGALYAVGTQLATSRDWPQWREDSEFRAAREASLKDAAQAQQ